MLPAIIEIHQALIKANYSEEDADNLVTRLMEEEAFEFVEFMNNREEDESINNNLLN